MKKTILIVATMFSVNAFGQKIEVVNGKKQFIVTQQNGIGAKKTLTIEITTPIENIKATREYAEFKDDAANFLATTEPQDTLAVLLSSRVTIGMLKIQYSLKNSTSLDFPEGGVGNVVVLKDEIWVTHPITAQNGYGSMVVSKAYLGKDNSFLSK
jgi:hypothetical protein